MDKVVSVSEKYIRNMVKQVLAESFNSLPEVEDVESYNVLNDNFDGNWREVLTARLYDKNDKCVGTLRDLHFKYDTEKDRLLGDRLL